MRIDSDHTKTLFAYPRIFEFIRKGMQNKGSTHFIECRPRDSAMSFPVRALCAKDIISVYANLRVLRKDDTRSINVCLA